MYLAVPPGQKTLAWSQMALDREARKLVNIANTVAAMHLRDGLTRIKFVEEIRDLVMQTLAVVRKTPTLDAFTQAVLTLRAETAKLLEQDRLIRTRAAQLYAKVEFVKENNKIVGYVISAVHIVISGITVVGGAMMMSTMTPMGLLAGAILVADGANGITKEISKLRLGNNSHSEGIVADKAIEVAKYLGFKGETGLAVFNAISLGAGVYGVFGLMRKPEAWRLFRWMPTDFYRKVDTMSRPQLTIKVVNYGLKAQVVFDLLTTSEKSH
ncbi:DUF4225 domain-containing protein [Serratia ureilytica]|uniref:DUF4225 domain-containing protein n=1 Tax=Serratia ureilytica TaxID=300181 RepID=UPI001AA1A6BD|nr:DUF4225 domain-containing protein [Serratia ureilytica]MBO1811588.1 DUF4225 domain-containing protein [Serratia ureilytica]